jgi:Replication factor-A protein 1, N-terminal domain
MPTALTVIRPAMRDAASCNWRTSPYYIYVSFIAIQRKRTRHLVVVVCGNTCPRICLYLRRVSMANLLVPGIIRTLHEGDVSPIPGHETPILQVLAVKKLAATNAAVTNTERWRIVLSDGEHFIQSMLATQLNHMIANNEIQKGVLVKLTQYTTNKMKEKKYVPCGTRGLTEIGDRLGMSGFK